MARALRRRRLDLAVCVLGGARRRPSPALLERLTGVADEVLVGLPDATPAEVARAARGTTIVTVQGATTEARRSELQARCSADWVLHLDADEFPSDALFDEPAWLQADGPGFATPRRWLCDPQRWLNDWPWWPDAEPRLLRRTTSPTELGATPLPILDAGLWVTTLLDQTLDERERRALQRDVVELGGPTTLRTPEVLRLLPERLPTARTAPIPAGERRAVEALLDGRRPRSPFGRRWTGQANAAAPWLHGEPGTPGAEVAVEVLDPSWHPRLHQQGRLLIALTNRGTTPWSSAGPDDAPRHLASYHWHLSDGRVVEGVRTDLPGTIAPGDRVVVELRVEPPPVAGPATLQIRVVQERVRWLDGEARHDVQVGASAPLPTARLVRPGGGTIPRVIHRIWLGGGAMPEQYVEYGRTWERLHPGWTMRLWTDDDAPMPAGIERARALSERADLVRYEVLRQHGGVYVDTDIECRRPIDDLLDGVVAFSAYEEPGRLCNALMGAVPGHPAMARLCELAAVTVGHGAYPQATATTFSTFVLERFDDVTLFAPDRFYSELWDGRVTTTDEPPHAIHHWAKSWHA